MNGAHGLGVGSDAGIDDVPSELHDDLAGTHFLLGLSQMLPLAHWVSSAHSTLHCLSPHE